MAKKTKQKFWKSPEVDFIFESYILFEERLKELMKVIPYNTAANKNAWSPVLVNLFVDICSTLDSTSRHIIGQGGGPNENVGAVRKKIKNMNVDDFEKSLWKKLEILDRRVVFYMRSLFPYCTLLPFEDYREKMRWWTAYNQLKHNRISNYTKGNLENTILALAALFLLITNYEDEEEFTKTLLYNGWLESDTVPEYVHAERLRGVHSFWLDSYFFGVPDRRNLIVSKNITKISPPFASRKFQKFVGRFNPII